MRKKLNQHFFVYLLVLSLIVTLGMYVQPLNNGSEPKPLETSKIEDDSAFIKANIKTISLESTTTTMTQPASSAIPESDSTSSTDPIVSIDSTPILASETNQSEINVVQEQTPTVIEKQTHTYEVTAYFLNIRKEPNATSDIIKVVKQGTALEVTSETDNVWLSLEGGGYIHGGYAQKVKKEVTVLSLGTPSNRQPSSAFNDNIEDRIKIIDNVEEDIEEQLTQPTSTVESDSGLTVAHIETIFEGTELSGHDLEQAILEVEDEYGINAYFTIAVMKLESGNGKSKLAKNKNNLFGLNAIDGDKYNKAFSFDTKGDSVRKFGQLLARNYVGKGLTTIEKVARKYCPANSKWSGLVKTIMKSDYRKL